MAVDGIYNAIQVNDQLPTSGQPTEDQLRGVCGRLYARHQSGSF